LKCPEEVRQVEFDERFVRMSDYYLAYCEGAFRERYSSDVQIMLSKLTGEVQWMNKSEMEALLQGSVDEASSTRNRSFALAVTQLTVFAAHVRLPRSRLAGHLEGTVAGNGRSYIFSPCFQPDDFSTGCADEARNFQRVPPQPPEKRDALPWDSVDHANPRRQSISKPESHFELLAATET
jgi:hypothetical protein